jgi:hypothetical protein
LLEQSFDYALDVLPKITPEQLLAHFFLEGSHDPAGRDDLEYVRSHGTPSCTVRGLLTGEGDQTAGLYVLIVKQPFDSPCWLSYALAWTAEAAVAT